MRYLLSMLLLVCVLSLQAQIFSWSPPPEQINIIVVSLSTDLNHSMFSHYDFDEVLFDSGGDLTLELDGRVSGLKAGRTYRLFMSIQKTGNGGTGSAQFRFVNLNDGSTIGDQLDILPPVFTGWDGSSQSVTEAFFTPIVDTSVGVDWDGGSWGEIGVRTIFIVQEIM